MNKKLILGLGIFGLAALGLLYVTNKNKKAKSDIDAKAKADAAEKKRQEDLARMNDPERKKLYDDIYLAMVKLLTNKINANYDRMIERCTTDVIDGDCISNLENRRRGELVGVNAIVVKWYNERLDTFNQMNIDELSLYLKILTSTDSILNEPFLYRQASELMAKYPKLEFE
jgi:hypothetical protein